MAHHPSHFADSSLGPVSLPADDFLDFVSAPGTTAYHAVAVAGAKACLDRFTAAFNAGDAAAMDAELRFPHTMYSGAERLVWDAPGQHPAGFFGQLRATGWVFTRYETREPVLIGADKVHFVITYTRRDGAKSILSVHCNLWVLTREDGVWKIALRSY